MAVYHVFRDKFVVLMADNRFRKILWFSYDSISIAIFL